MIRWLRIGFAAAAVLLIAAGAIAVNTFHSRLYFVLAMRGTHDEATHEKYLRMSLSKDPSYGYANLAMARVAIRQTKYGAAQEFQSAGMRSFRPFRGYQQLATVQERLNRPLDAMENYEKSLRMYPSDLTSLEHLALLAYNAREEETFERAITTLTRVDLNNLNAYYLQALNARRSGNNGAEFRNLQFISTELARRTPDRPLLFSENVIAHRLRLLASGQGNE